MEILNTLLALLQITSYFLSLILAGYTLSRSHYHPMAWLSAGVLISYSVIQMDQFLGQHFAASGLNRGLWGVYPLPSILWVRIAIWLKPAPQLDIRLDRLWWTLLLPVTMLLIFGGWIGNGLVDFATYERGDLYWAYALYNVGLAMLTVGLLYRNFQQIAPQDKMRRVYGGLVMAGLGYAGSMLLLLSGLLAPAWVFALILVDILLLGLAAIAYEAVSEGQQIKADLTLILIKATLLCLLVVIPWAIGVAMLDNLSLPFALALFFTLAVIGLGVSLQGDFDGLLERVVWGRRNTQSEQLRSLLLNSALQAPAAASMSAFSEDEFIRLTRRALSHMPNLPRLAASPLTSLHIISQRVDEDATVLERAKALRLLLTECIETLRPTEYGGYGTTDEWRFFNALYYPYVMGLSPYKNSAFAPADQATHEILQWFQVAVPPRTLYNWQNRGAEIIAQILLTREQQPPQSG